MLASIRIHNLPEYGVAHLCCNISIVFPVSMQFAETGADNARLRCVIGLQGYSLINNANSWLWSFAELGCFVSQKLRCGDIFIGRYITPYPPSL